MKRYIAKERQLTPGERLVAYRARVTEAQDEAGAALFALGQAIASEPPITATDYVEVKSGEPGYDDAPYENSLVMEEREMAFAVASKPSPWLSLIERGEFPGGLSTL